jgi:transposase-like protein
MRMPFCCQGMHVIVPLKNNEIGSCLPMSMARLCLWIGSAIMELIKMSKKKGQHYLKSAAVRDFTVKDVGDLTEEGCHDKFIEVFWGGRDQVVCHHCGAIGRHYYRRARKQWRCKDCDGYFSVTVGTPFEDHKLPFKTMLLGMTMFITNSNGISTHLLARTMDVTIKTAHVFVGKLREALYSQRFQEKLRGTIHIDGGHFGGRPRHGRVRRVAKEDIEAHVEARIMGRKQRNKGRSKDNYRRLAKRRIVMTLRELFADKGLGARRTITVVCMSENEKVAVDLARKFVEPGSVVMTDENPAYNQLSRWFDHRTVQHAVEFATKDGVSDNQAESYFSRLRRYVLGVALRIEPKYLADIANEMSWKEDVRRISQWGKLKLLLGAMSSNGRSKWWRGYWQGYHRKDEILWIVG